MATTPKLPIATISGSFTEWASKKVEVVEYIGKRILTEGGKMLIIGEKKFGKSRIMIQTAIELALGLPWLGSVLVPEPRRVLMFSMEGSEAEHVERLQNYEKCYGNLPDKDMAKLIVLPWMPLVEAQGAELFEREVASFQPEVVLLDPWYSINIGDENNAALVTNTLRVVDLASWKYHFSPVIAMHTKKATFDARGNPVDYGFDSVSGSYRFTAWATTTALCVRKAGQRSLRFLLRAGKDLEPAALEEVDENQEDGGLKRFKLLVGAENNRAQDIIKILHSLKRARVTELMARLKLSKQSVYNALEPLQVQGLVVREPGPNKKFWYWRLV